MLWMLLYALSYVAPPPAPPSCAPPPKITVTVICEAHEGCAERWIFVSPSQRSEARS